MKALLIDDEQANLDNLRIMLETYCPQVEVCGTALDTEEATILLRIHHPELVFLDIQMPRQNGFDWLQSLPSHDFGIIFVTAYDQYAIRALRFAAVDYLLKPVNIHELQAAVKIANEQHLLKEQNKMLRNLVQVLKEDRTATEQQIALATFRETYFVKTNEIIRCESSNNYTTFYLTDGSAILVCKPIYLYDDLLVPHGFVRCHQSHLINRAFIKSWKKDLGDFLLLTDGAEVPISRRKKDEVKKMLRL